MQMQKVLGLALLMGWSAQAQQVNVRGKVSDGNGKAVANAIVELVNLKLKDTTGTDGTYSIAGPVSALRGSIQAFRNEVSFSRGVLDLSMGKAANVKVEVFDIKGNLTHREVYRNTSTGRYRLDLRGRLPSNQLSVVRASFGDEAQTFQYMPSAYETEAGITMAASAPVSARLAKVSATVDTLKVTATGFAAKSIALSSYDTTLNVTVDASEDRWGGLKNPPVKSSGCGKAAGITNGKKTITSGGKSRSYTIDIPANYDNGKPYKFFYCSHWIGSNAEAVVGQKFYWLKDQATAAGEQAIFLAPQALPGDPNGTWATGPYINSNPNDSIDNVLFTDILKYVKDNLCIDGTRVFATGFSFGGMMTYSLSENRQNLIRAAVGIAPANYNIYVPPKKHEPIAWMQTTGMSDGTCPWICTGGQCNSQKDGAKFIALGHATDNGCTLPAGDNIPTTNSGPHSCYDFTGCKKGYPVKACTFNGGHTNDQKDPNSNVNWIPVESWKFFSQF